jgi:hypothetical protein
MDLVVEYQHPKTKEWHFAGRFPVENANSLSHQAKQTITSLQDLQGYNVRSRVEQ